MILEVAILNVIDGLQASFEADFQLAGKYISSAEGYLRHSLSQCQEQPCRYLLMVEWQSLESHTIGFRQSAQYQEWRKLLNHYYDPFPVVEHYQTLMSVEK